MDTVNFRESWDVLKDRLADAPKDAPLFTYCTGGIRCVKVGAYLTQELGFTNVNRLAGGIIAYDHTLADKAPEENSLFKGTNFVFDGRLGRARSDQLVGSTRAELSEQKLGVDQMTMAFTLAQERQAELDAERRMLASAVTTRVRVSALWSDKYTSMGQIEHPASTYSRSVSSSSSRPLRGEE